MTRIQNYRRRRGNAIVEAAIAVPLMFLMMMGAADFARVFYHAVTVDSAANAGAFFGAQSNVYSGHNSGMNAVAQADAVDLSTRGGVNVTPSRFCACPSGSSANVAVTCPAGLPTGTVCVDCIGGSCTGYGAPRLYTRAVVTHDFDPVIPHPFVESANPNTANVGRAAFFRVQ